MSGADWMQVEEFMAGATILAALAATVWAYLILFRGGFWRIREREDRAAPAGPSHWPAIVAVIPARDEADVLPSTLGSLLTQNYPGDFRIVLVDDHSVDGTAEVARAAARQNDAESRLDVLPGAALPPGWTGKLWAVSQGIERAFSRRPDFILLTDADILYGSNAVRRLAARAADGGYGLTSVMVRLRCESLAERALIPAFVFFFRMLYPFHWVNDPNRSTAAAAGGCMLAKTEELIAAGGVAAIRSALIDDCALGARMKARGAIWLGMSDDIVSARPYPRLADIGAMVSRSAYAQLRYSPVLLVACLFGMCVVYLAPPALAAFGAGWSRWLGLGAWAAMAVAFAPIARFYGQRPWRGIALPAIAAVYVIYTMRSALDFWRGRGGMWKGRAQAMSEA